MPSITYAVVSFLLLVGGFSILVAPTETFAVNVIQQTKIQDNIGCDTSSDCTNTGRNVASVLSGDNNLIRQNLDQVNGCIFHSICANSPNTDSGITDNPVGNFAELRGDGNLVNQDIQSVNTCISSNCESKMDTGTEIEGSKNNVLQQVVQNNNCSDSECQNKFDVFFLAHGDANNNTVIIKGKQLNTCYIESNCRNHVGFAFGGGTDGYANVPVSQKNVCLENSACDNFAVIGSQSNYCLNDSSCSNVGNGIMQNICVNGVRCDNEKANNENICVNGAECENGGIDSKVISVGDPCHNTSSNITVICISGRIITRPS